MAVQGTLTGLLAAQPPASVALIDEARPITFAELDEASRRLATGLLDLGLQAGDRLAVLLPNLPAWPELVFASARIGVILVAINTRFRDTEVVDIVSRSGCKAMVRLTDEHPLTPSLVLLYEPLPTDEPLSARETVAYDALLRYPPCDNDRATPETPVAIFTTSGTTSLPKFVLHKQSALAAHARAAAGAFGYCSDDTVTLQATPFCGIYGFSQAMATLAAGRPIVLLPSFNAVQAARLVDAERVTQFNGTDEMLRQLLSAAAEQRPFPSLRFFGCAIFGPAAAEIVASAESRGLRVRGLFGMSETQALLCLQPDELPLPERMQAGGIGVSAEVEVRTRDRETGELLPVGESGELEFRTPGMMVEYFNDPGATAEVFTGDGYLRSGDLGFTRADGGFVFQARMGDVLRLGGYLVSPREIELQLNRHAGVASSQVVGIAVQNRLRAIAFVIAAPGVTCAEDEVLAHCRDTLAAFKVPHRVFVVDEFPTADGPNGRKVQKGQLRELAQRLCDTPG